MSAAGDDVFDVSVCRGARAGCGLGLSVLFHGLAAVLMVLSPRALQSPVMRPRVGIFLTLTPHHTTPAETPPPPFRLPSPPLRTWNPPVRRWSQSDPLPGPPRLAPTAPQQALLRLEAPAVPAPTVRALPTNVFADAQPPRAEPDLPERGIAVGMFYSTVEPASGGDSAIRSTTAAGFAEASFPTSNAQPAARAVQHGSFPDAGLRNPLSAPARPRSLAAVSSPVEILFKPRPAYPEQARRLRIEGSVLLEVRFTASGEVEVQRVIRGLGHGLDENAIDAARAIRFKPAQRDGHPIDSKATVYITFELAY